MRCVQSRSTDLVALYGEVDGSYMDGMLPLMIGGKDDTNRTWGGVDLERSGTSVHAHSTIMQCVACRVAAQTL